jgi:hypothetical protein
VTIQNERLYLDSIWNWRPLRKCFPRGIEPLISTAGLRIGGYFLVLEGKGTNVPLKDGQRITFERMQRWNQTIPRLFTIIVIWGDAKVGRIDQLQFWPSPPFSGGWDQLLAYVSAWREWADGFTEPPSAKESTPPVVVAHREVQRVDRRKQQELSASRMSDAGLANYLDFARDSSSDADCRQWVEVLELELRRRKHPVGAR